MAVYDSMIVDSDSNEFELARRIELRHQFDLTLSVLIIRVARTLEEHIETERLFPHFESPEIANQDYS